MSLGDVVGPARLPCEQACEVPAGVTLRGVPMPRHAWGDVLICPNGCGRAWLVLEAPPKLPPDAGQRTAPHGDPLAAA